MQIEPLGTRGRNRYVPCMTRGFLRHLMNALLGGGDSDSVTRRIRAAQARHGSSRMRPVRRTLLVGLMDAVAGRQSAHVFIRQLTDRKRRT